MSARIYLFPGKRLQTIDEFVELLMSNENYNVLTDHEQKAVCIASQVVAFNFHDANIRREFCYLLYGIAIRHKFIRFPR